MKPAIALCLGIALHRAAHFTTAEILVPFLVLVAITLSARRVAPQVAGVPLLCAVTAGGILLAEFHRPSAAPILNADSGETLILEGCVVDPPLFHEGREQFTLEIAPEARVRVSLLLDDQSESPAWRYGQRVELPARIRTPRNFGNPGAFDYTRYLARKQIYWTATAKPGPDLKLLSGTCGHPVQALLFRLREAALLRTSALFGNSRYHEALLDALLLGESSRLERAWTEDYRRTGTYHALIISGLHITIIATGLLWVTRLLFVPRKIALAAATGIAWIYALASGGSAPAVRSAALFTLFAVASLLYRKGRLLNLLSATALMFLVCDPAQLFEPSFQLSFLAVAAIGALAQPVLEATSERWREGVKHIASTKPDHRLAPVVAEARIELRYLAVALGWPRLIWPIEAILRSLRAIWSTATVTALVQAGLLLPTLLYFHRVSVTSIAANLIAVPLLTICVPFGFLTLATGWTPLVWITTSLVDVARRIVEWQAALEPSWRVPDPPLISAVIAAVSLIAAACWKRMKPALLATALSGGLIWAAFQHEPPKGELQLQVLDVGQGDCLLITLPDGKRILIDGGGIPVFGKGRKPSLDIGEDVVSSYLWSLGITELDAVAFTHAHEDHAGGLKAIFENFHPRELWTGANADDSEPWRRIRAIAIANQMGVKQLRAGDVMTRGGVRFEALSPPRDYQATKLPRNDDSLALQLSYGRHRFLLTGDMERASEMLLAGSLRKIDVLKVAHHGSRSSTTQEFLDESRPAVAIVSAGAGNLYRHPHPEVLKRLDTARIATFRTDRHGLISVRSDGRYLDVQPYRRSLDE